MMTDEQVLEELQASGRLSYNKATVENSHDEIEYYRKFNLTRKELTTLPYLERCEVVCQLCGVKRSRHLLGIICPYPK